MLLTIAVLLLLMDASAGAVDCEMARRVAASYSKAELRTMGTPEQRAAYMHCFKKQRAAKMRSRR